MAVVTGAASGIGRALAVQLASKGCSLALCDVDLEQLAVTAAAAAAAAPPAAAAAAAARAATTGGGPAGDNGGGDRIKISQHKVDVANEKEVSAFRDAVLMEHPGGVQLLINNAGIACDGRMVHTEEASQAEIDEYRRGWDRCFNVDFYGVLYCTRAFLPALRASDSACLVNVSSINAAINIMLRID